ncbi:sensor histidine kinase [Paenibacillus glycanilyticus]|uniref:sensor histidine kinase n=1 Tax=Paenibacillus glycanilyticus TaxID=126569 RepID=UPI0013E3B861|nr:histidine kinase [Paenibacillus glycanilyticus]
MQLTIHTRLFLSFTLLCSILVASSSFLFYRQTSKDLAIRGEETNRQQLYRYQEALDNMIEDLDRISAQVIYSSDIKNYLYEQSQEESSSFQSYAKRKKYEDLLASLNGPWFIATQINLITLEGFFLTYGQNMNNTVSDLEAQIRDARWIQDAIKLDGEKLLVPPHPSKWQQTLPFNFSLVRSFRFPASQTPAVVEVEQTYEHLSDTMEIGRNENSQAKVYVKDDAGNVFYPIAEPDRAQPSLPQWTGDVKEIGRENSNDTDIWSQLRSDYSGLTVMIQQPKNEFMQPIAHLRRITWVLAILGEVVSLMIAYFLSAGISAPIRYLQKRLEKLTIDNVNTVPVKKLNRTKEIAVLYSTFESMKESLNHSLNEVLQSQKRENLAHLQAMYAQMNPHFLFNTLTAMASYAEESGFPDQARIAQKLSGMLRYATNSLSEAVTLKQEMQYTVQYMDLMQFRYEGQFNFIVHVDPDLEYEPVPKFLLQPLVENSFTHGFQMARPPWKIELTAVVSEDLEEWEIRMSDNGSGFSEEALRETQALIAELNEGQIRQLENLSAQGIGNLGIVNTLTRCRLFWNEKVQFELRNRQQGMEFTLRIRRSI